MKHIVQTGVLSSLYRFGNAIQLHAEIQRVYRRTGRSAAFHREKQPDERRQIPRRRHGGVDVPLLNISAEVV